MQLRVVPDEVMQGSCPRPLHAIEGQQAQIGEIRLREMAVHAWASLGTFPKWWRAAAEADVLLPLISEATSKDTRSELEDDIRQLEQDRSADMVRNVGSRLPLIRRAVALLAWADDLASDGYIDDRVATGRGNA
jgi:hypothetical protein